MSLYLNKVTISGVMGIPNELPLDFTAPLTLIYAPNGTGKTSTWTAVKALMSLGVTDDIACRAPGAVSPRVTAELRVGDRHCVAIAADGKLELIDQLKSRAVGTEALSWLAPEVNTIGIQTKGGVLRDRLIGQIESCRFLPSESLLYLIDSGEESAELRRKLFADLTGTAAIQAEVRETKRYRDVLSMELEAVSRELAKVEEQAGAFAVEHNPDSSDPLHLIATAASLVGIDLPATFSASQALAALREAQLTMAAALEASRSAFLTLRSIESTYSQLDRDLDAASEEMKIADAAQLQIRASLKNMQHEAAKGDVRRAREEHERFQQGLGRVAAIMAVEGRTKKVTESTVAALRRMVRPFISEHAIESRLDALVRLNKWRPKYQSQLRQRAEMHERRQRLLDQAQIPAQEIRVKLEEKMAQLSGLNGRITSLSDLAASLRVRAEGFVRASQSSICPCCSHRWESVDALLISIAEADAIGNVQLKRDIDALQVAIDQLQKEYSIAQVIEEQLRDCEVTISRLSADLDEVERVAAANDVMLSRLQEADNTLQEVYELQSLLSAWRLIEALSNLRIDVEEEMTVEMVLVELSARSEVLKVAVMDAEQAEAVRKSRLEREQNALSMNIELARSLRTRLMDLTNLKHQRDSAVALLKSNGISASAQSSVELEQRMATSGMLQNLIMQASAAVEVSAAISARDRITMNQSRLQLRRDKISDELQLANRLIELLGESEIQAGQRFFDQLGPAVGTLFDHMQVNRVFRALSIRTVKESFSVDGQLDDGVTLDPGEHFSQGQRQDLALSIFLVRAASLGGSFFLDEPLVHLDDLNRTALLDCLRACVLGTVASPRPVRLIVTTANWSVARHLMQKFYSVRHSGVGPLLRVIQLSGNVGSRVQQSVVFPVNPQREEARPH